MIDYVVWATDTGAIIRNGTVSSEDEMALQPLGSGEKIMLVEIEARYATHYVAGDELVERPVLPLPENLEILANSVEEAVLSGLPDPCIFLLDGEKITVTGGELALSSDVPAVYTLELNQWPYLPGTTRIVTL